MFDITKLSDAFGSLLSGSSAERQTAIPEEITQLLANAGIDPSTLASMTPPELETLLSELGIDPSQIDLAALGELAQGEGVAASLQEIANDWLRSRQS
jgi:hypothetical protein